MKLVEAPGGIDVFLTNDEHRVWECLGEETCKSDLSERQAYIAQNLVHKGVVKRSVREGKTYYSKLKGSL
jgi:hypothetical protein